MPDRAFTPQEWADRLGSVMYQLTGEGELGGWVSGLPPDAAERMKQAVDDYCADYETDRSSLGASESSAGGGGEEPANKERSDVKEGDIKPVEEKRISDEKQRRAEVAKGLREAAGSASPGDDPDHTPAAGLLNLAADLLQATPPDGRIGETVALIEEQLRHKREAVANYPAGSVGQQQAIGARKSLEHLLGLIAALAQYPMGAGS